MEEVRLLYGFREIKLKSDIPNHSHIVRTPFQFFSARVEVTGVCGRKNLAFLFNWHERPFDLVRPLPSV